MANLTALRVDPVSSEDGIWVPWVEDIELLIARQGSTKFTEYIQKHAQDDKKFDDDEKYATNMTYAHTILLGWKNIQIDGEEVLYSPETAYEFLSDPELIDFRNFVIITSASVAAFRKDKLEASAKN